MPQPQPLPDSHPTSPGRRRIYCRRCRRKLSTIDSRARGYGPECDPEQHPPTPDTPDIDQDTLPGT